MILRARGFKSLNNKIVPKAAVFRRLATTAIVPYLIWGASISA